MHISEKLTEDAYVGVRGHCLPRLGRVAIRSGPRLGGVAIRRAACGTDGCVIPLGPPAQPLEPLGIHPHVSTVNDEPCVVVQG